MEELFFILSMERTSQNKNCVWWQPDACGYTTSIGEAGRYTRAEAMQHSDPPHHLVVPCNAIEVPASRAKAFAKKALKESRWYPLDLLSEAAVRVVSKFRTTRHRQVYGDAIDVEGVELVDEARRLSE